MLIVSKSSLMIGKFSDWVKLFEIISLNKLLPEPEGPETPIMIVELGKLNRVWMIIFNNFERL